MRNFVPALEESLMKFSPSEMTRPQPDTKYTSHGGWFSVESFSVPAKTEAKKRFVKGARA